MEKAILFTLLLSFISCSKSNYPVDLFCRDINTALIQIQTHAENLANIKTTRTKEGGYYKKKIIKSCKDGFCEIGIDQSSPIEVYQPKHPDAKKNGYVEYPPFNEEEETYHLKKAQRLYQWIMGASKFDGEDFLLSDKFKHCYKKYPSMNNTFNLKAQLGR